MNDKRGRKLIIACVCILLSVVFLASSFLQKRKLKDEKENKEIQTLETEEGEPEPELYQEGELITVYFTNTEQIDEKGALPYRELEQLNEKTQEFLKSKKIKDTELRVIEGSIRKEGDKTYFSCRAENSGIVLEIGFDESNEEFDFALKGGGE